MHLERIDCMPSISLHHCLFCNDLERHPLFFVLFIFCNVLGCHPWSLLFCTMKNNTLFCVLPQFCKIVWIYMSEVYHKIGMIIEHDHTNERSDCCGPLCKLNPCMVAYI